LNVIILIGDGMGTSQLSVPYYYGKKEPVFSYFGNVGLVETSSSTHKVTYSAASGTAMFTGRKTYNDAIGVDTDTLIRTNLVELLSEENYLTGVISSASITDATPASFYAHDTDRRMHYDIANWLLRSEIDFFAGGGLQYFISTDGQDHFVLNNIELNVEKLKKIKKPEAGKRYGFLLANNGLPTMEEGRGDFLSEATKISLDYFSNFDQGFLLMVEGAQIDWAGHANNTDYLVAEMMDFEETCRVAYNYAKKQGNTLVIVTSDHETGGFTLSASGERRYGADYATITPTFSTTSHSASLVPLLAYGPGAEKFRGILHNTEVFFRIIDLVMDK
ncbi:MAG: alkaline phosphatase, partial [Spirochaetales bacterium]|nr:alkaline phosphatase [Spirochaetales bacterium]